MYPSKQSLVPLTTGFISLTTSAIDDSASFLAPGLRGGGERANQRAIYIYIYVYKVSDYSRSGILAEFN